MDWEFGISRYRLLYIKWISNKVLLYKKMKKENRMPNTYSKAFHAYG